MFRNVVWSETAESCLNKTTNNDAYGADTMGQEPFNQFIFKKQYIILTGFIKTSDMPCCAVTRLI